MSLTSPDQEDLTAEQVAIEAQRSVQTIWRWVRAGRLQGRRLLGRTVFSRTDVNELVALLMTRKQRGPGGGTPSPQMEVRDGVAQVHGAE